MAKKYYRIVKPNGEMFQDVETFEEASSLLNLTINDLPSEYQQRHTIEKKEILEEFQKFIANSPFKIFYFYRDNIYYFQLQKIELSHFFEIWKKNS